MRRAAWIAIVVLVGCGDDDAEPRRLAGSPDAVRALAFDGRGTPVAIGGPSTFGLAHLQRQDGETWLRATGVAAFGAQAQLLGGGDLPLYAVSASTLYRLADAPSFGWEAFAIPQGATPGTMFGVAASGHVHALERTDADGDGAVVRWLPGEVRWTEVPGTRPLGAGAHAFTVAPGGRIAWSVPGIGIASSADGAQVLVLDCAADPVGVCTGALAALALDANDDLTFLACAGEAPRVIRLRGATFDEVAVPPELPACHGLYTIADGTTLLASLDGTDGDAGGLLLLGADGSSWRRVAAASRAFTYVLRDRATGYAHGDGQAGRGIHELEL